MDTTNTSMKITLRPFKTSDVDDFLSYAGDDNVMRLTRWKAFTSKEDAATYIQDVCIPHHFFRSICVEDRSIGFVSIEPAEQYTGDKNEGLLSYVISPECWGQGIATRAAKMAISEAVEMYPNIDKILAGAHVDNKASHRVLEKLGFVNEELVNNIPIKDVTWDLYAFRLKINHQSS